MNAPSIPTDEHDRNRNAIFTIAVFAASLGATVTIFCASWLLHTENMTESVHRTLIFCTIVGFGLTLRPTFTELMLLQKSLVHNALFTSTQMFSKGCLLGIWVLLKSTALFMLLGLLLGPLGLFMLGFGIVTILPVLIPVALFLGILSVYALQFVTIRVRKEHP